MGRFSDVATVEVSGLQVLDWLSPPWMEAIREEAGEANAGEGAVLEEGTADFAGAAGFDGVAEALRWAVALTAC